MIITIPWIDCKKIAYIYPVELLVGCIIASLLGEDTISKQRKSRYILQPGNIINRILAYRGNTIWTCLFVGLAFIRMSLEHQNSVPLPRDARTIARSPMMNGIKQLICKLVLKNVLLILIFAVIDNVFILTGGSCSDGSNTRSAERCKLNGGEWDGGFDISGHFCFIVNLSMILWIELRQLQDYVREQEITVNKWFQSILIMVVLVLLVWIGMLMITSIYYHTFFEKVLGCAMGYISPVVLYIAIPKSSKLNRLLYR